MAKLTRKKRKLQTAKQLRLAKIERVRKLILRFAEILPLVNYMKFLPDIEVTDLNGNVVTNWKQPAANDVFRVGDSYVWKTL